MEGEALVEGRIIRWQCLPWISHALKNLIWKKLKMSLRMSTCFPRKRCIKQKHEARVPSFQVFWDSCFFCFCLTTWCYSSLSWAKIGAWTHANTWTFIVRCQQNARTWITSMEDVCLLHYIFLTKREKFKRENIS